MCSPAGQRKENGNRMTEWVKSIIRYSLIGWFCHFQVAPSTSDGSFSALEAMYQKEREEQCNRCSLFGGRWKRGWLHLLKSLDDYSILLQIPVEQWQEYFTEPVLPLSQVKHFFVIFHILKLTRNSSKRQFCITSDNLWVIWFQLFYWQTNSINLQQRFKKTIMMRKVLMFFPLFKYSWSHTQII